MVAEPWIQRIISSHVTSNLKPKNKQETIGILSFEVANTMTKTVRLHKSLTNSQISNLKTELRSSDGIKTLVSTDDAHLFDLALSEKLEELSFIAGVVSRLGRKCTTPQLQGFQYVFGDVISGAIDVRELGFLVKDMEAMVRKMERFVDSTSTLYVEMEVLNELEMATKKFQQNHHEETRKVLEQKLIWQIQDVSHLKNVSLWNQTYDKIMEILARTVCTLFARIDSIASVSNVNPSRIPASANSNLGSRNLFNAKDLVFGCGLGAGRLFMDCASNHDHDDCDDGSVSSTKAIKITTTNHKGGYKGHLQARPDTVGGCGLALHYAKVVIVIEKLLNCPHLVSEEARDDLYRMLPRRLRVALKQSLKCYDGKYEAGVAQDWKDRVDGVLGCVGPLAHDMIRWQSERSLEQRRQHMSRSRSRMMVSVVLVQTLYFADRGKAEAAICELLVGLNYICGYQQQQNALLDCATSFELLDDWQLE